VQQNKDLRTFFDRLRNAGPDFYMEAKRQVIAIPPSQAPVKEVILKGKDVDLGILPITRRGELDSGKFITAGCTICKHPDTGNANAGMYRHEVKGKNKLGISPHAGHHFSYIARRHAELGKPMEVAIQP